MGPWQSHHWYQEHQKQGHQYRHHHDPPADDVQHAPRPPVWPVGGAPRREVAGEAEEAGGVATSAEEDEPVAGPLVISSRTRSSRTCMKEGEGPLASDPCLQVVIGAAQAAHDIEHQDPIGHRIPEVVKSIGYALHPPAVLTNGEVPLHEGAEGDVELEGAILGVPLERHPGLPRGATVGPDKVLKI